MSHSTEQLAPATPSGSSFVGRALIAVALLSAVAMAAAGMRGHSHAALAASPAATSQVAATATNDTSVPAASEVFYRSVPRIEDQAPTF